MSIYSTCSHLQESAFKSSSSAGMHIMHIAVLTCIRDRFETNNVNISIHLKTKHNLPELYIVISVSNSFTAFSIKRTLDNTNVATSSIKLERRLC